MTLDDVVESILAAGIAVVVGGIIVAFLAALSYFMVILAAEKQCLAAGYPKAVTDWSFNRYCVKRLNQTDIVVPLKDVAK